MRVDYAERKAELATRAQIDRARVTLKIYEIKGIVAPDPAQGRAASLRPIAAALLGVAGPMAGRARIARWLRIANIALIALRVVRDWRRR